MSLWLIPKPLLLFWNSAKSVHINSSVFFKVLDSEFILGYSQHLLTLNQQHSNAKSLSQHQNANTENVNHLIETTFIFVLKCTQVLKTHETCPWSCFLNDLVQNTWGGVTIFFSCFECFLKGLIINIQPHHLLGPLVYVFNLSVSMFFVFVVKSICWPTRTWPSCRWPSRWWPVSCRPSAWWGWREKSTCTGRSSLSWTSAIWFAIYLILNYYIVQDTFVLFSSTVRVIMSLNNRSKKFSNWLFKINYYTKRE